MDAIAADPSPLSGRLLVVGVGLAGLAVIAYFALGMPAGITRPRAPARRAPVWSPLESDEFGSRLEAPGAFVVKVHVPEGGGLIDGTTAEIPYGRVTGDGRLPADNDTPLLLHCRRGHLSAVTGVALFDAGFTDVAQLQGGTDAWERTGFPLGQR